MIRQCTLPTPDWNTVNNRLFKINWDLDSLEAEKYERRRRNGDEKLGEVFDIWMVEAE